MQRELMSQEQPMEAGMEAGPMESGPMESGPMEGDAIEADDDAIFQQMTAKLLDYIFDKGEEAISGKLKGASDLGEEIGMTTFTLVSEASRQAEEAGKDIDMDIIFGVATHVIDALIELADALGLQPDENAIREDAMIVAVQSYVQSMPPDSEQAEAAQMMLAEMAGDIPEAEAMLSRAGQRHGVDPFAPPPEPQGQTPIQMMEAP
jgi:hypothetical protein